MTPAIRGRKCDGMEGRSEVAVLIHCSCVLVLHIEQKHTTVQTHCQDSSNALEATQARGVWSFISFKVNLPLNTFPCFSENKYSMNECFFFSLIRNPRLKSGIIGHSKPLGGVCRHSALHLLSRMSDPAQSHAQNWVQFSGVVWLT